MKTISARDMQKHVKECIDASQKDRVIITRHGKPSAVIFGIEGTDWENAVLETDAAFWKAIHARRKQPTISLARLKSRLMD